MRSDEFKRAHGPYKHGDKWRVILIRPDGGRVVRSAPTRAQAEEGLRDLSIRATGSRSIRSAVTEYLAAVADDRGIKQCSIDRIEYHLEKLLHLEANGERPLTWLKNRGAELYDLARATPPGAKKPPAVDTHRNALNNGRAFGVWCVKKKWLRVDPFADVEGKGQRRAGREKPQLRINEARKLTNMCLALCTPTVEPEPVAVLAAELLGTRATELVVRDVRDLDDDGRIFWIPDAKTPSGRRANEVPEVLRPLLLALAGNRDGSAPLFVATGRRGARRASRHWLYYHCDRLCRAAGVPSVSPHGLRRSHMSIARAAGVTGHVVADQVGHGSTAVQDRSYVAVGAAETGQRDRVLRIVQGGKR